MSSFDQLKTLLLGAERKHLSDLDQRVEDIETRESSIGEQLPRAIREMSDDPNFLASLDKPVTQTLHHTIQRDVQSFAEVLFPVMGPAIRRAVADAMKNLVQRINVAMEQALSVRSLRWRLESIRTGVPVAQIVLQNTMVFSVLEAFLVHAETGLVIGRAVKNNVLALDEDAATGMLTAIQSFIQDSFGGDRNEVLRSAELGDRTLWVISGPNAALACVIAGSPPRELRDLLMQQLESLHFRFSSEFDDYDLAKANEPAINEALQQCLLEQLQERERSGSVLTRIAWGVAVLALLAALAYWMLQNRDQQQQVAIAESAFAAQQGYVVENAEWSDGRVQLDLLRDPAADAAPELLQAAGVDPATVNIRSKPFYSLDPGLVARRLAVNSGLNNAAAFVIDGTSVHVGVPVSSEQAQTIRNLVLYHPVLSSVSFEEIVRSDDLAAEILQAIGASEGVSLAINDSTGVLMGFGAHSWIVRGRAQYPQLEGISLNWSRLWPRELMDLKATADALLEQRVMFNEDTEILPGSMAALQSIGNLAQQLITVAGERDVDLVLQVQGVTDGVGTPQYNHQLRLQRAKIVCDRLRELGISEEHLRVEASPIVAPEGRADDFRRVELQLSY